MLRTLGLWFWLSAAILVSATPRVGQATPETAAGPVQELRQHLEQLGVPRWHQLGWRGQGVKVAVIDSGFRGYRSALGKCLAVRKSIGVSPDSEHSRRPRRRASQRAAEDRLCPPDSADSGQPLLQVSWVG